ncbi:MAG: hypothetical protein KBO60_18295 [Achromobacter sp.]|nr:hypothetical protein [Achromobacter sp.]
MTSFSGLHFFLLGVAAGIALMGVMSWLASKAAEHEALIALDEHPLPAMPQRRRFRDALPVETTHMIQRELKAGAGTRPCTCGRTPRLIETRGNPMPGQLAKEPTTVYHLECPPCLIATARDRSQLVVQAQWNVGASYPIAAPRLTA